MDLGMVGRVSMNNPVLSTNLGIVRRLNTSRNMDPDTCTSMSTRNPLLSKDLDIVGRLNMKLPNLNTGMGRSRVVGMAMEGGLSMRDALTTLLFYSLVSQSIFNFSRILFLVKIFVCKYC